MLNFPQLTLFPCLPEMMADAHIMDNLLTSCQVTAIKTDKIFTASFTSIFLVRSHLTNGKCLDQHLLKGESRVMIASNFHYVNYNRPNLTAWNLGDHLQCPKFAIANNGLHISTKMSKIVDKATGLTNFMSHSITCIHNSWLSSGSRTLHRYPSPDSGSAH